MIHTLNDAVKILAKMKEEVRADEDILRKDYLYEHIDDLADKLERADEEMGDIENKYETERVKRAEAESFLAYYEERYLQQVSFSCTSIEDEGKIEILQRMYKNYTWNELTEIEKSLIKQI